MTDIIYDLEKMFPMYPNGTIEKRTLNKAIDEIKNLRIAIEKITHWYNTDGSVGSLADLMDEVEHYDDKTKWETIEH